MIEISSLTSERLNGYYLFRIIKIKLSNNFKKDKERIKNCLMKLIGNRKSYRCRKIKSSKS